MVRKFMRMVWCASMVAALVLGFQVVAKKSTAADMVKNSLGKMVKKPQYGGVLTMALEGSPTGLDDAYVWGAGMYPVFLTNEELYEGDYTKGSQGTGEAGFMIQGTIFLDYSRPRLATSYELKNGDTIIYHLRKGVRWQNRPPANGREFDSSDAVATLKRNFTFKKASLARLFKPDKRPLSIKALDKYTVEIKCAPGTLGEVLSRTIDYAQMIPKETIKKYGGQQDWRNVVGTGPYMMKEYIPGSKVSLVRNPDYWGTDPLHPKNKLPYLDGVDMVIISDASTKLAGFRTGKIDWVKNIGWEDAAELHKSNPSLKAKSYAEAAHFNVIHMRLDKPKLPFKDIRVRRALARAVDNVALKDDYYGGNAVLLSTPAAPYPELKSLYRTLDQYSEEVQKDYGYDPEGAKKLLAEAGYPKGFKTKILAWKNQVPLLSIIKSMWSQIGVDLEIDVREYGVFRSMAFSHKNEEMVMFAVPSVAPAGMQTYLPGNRLNYGMIKDPTIEKVYDIVRSNVVLNDPVAYKALYDWYPYEKEQCWYIETPTPILEIIWQPWLKQYGGEWTVGLGNQYNFPKWVWLDQKLKMSRMGN